MAINDLNDFPPMPPVFGSLSLEERAQKLRTLDDQPSVRGSDAETYDPNAPRGIRGLFRTVLWEHTGHNFGYIPPTTPGTETQLDIFHAGNIAADENLRNSRVIVTLDALRVAEYPGRGEHQILFDFYAQNRISGSVEPLHFSSTYRVQAGDQAAITGYPIFVGLNVGTNGVMFRCYTVAVKNSFDELLVSFLELDVFKAGLQLVSTAQPALAPLTALASGLTSGLARRNVPVQDIQLGLDFSQIATRARLAVGSFIAVQLPPDQQSTWDWRQYVYNKNNGQVVNREDGKIIGYNYLIFSVSRYVENAV